MISFQDHLIDEDESHNARPRWRFTCSGWHEWWFFRVDSTTLLILHMILRKHAKYSLKISIQARLVIQEDNLTEYFQKSFSPLENLFWLPIGDWLLPHLPMTYTHFFLFLVQLTVSSQLKCSPSHGKDFVCENI